MANQIETTGRVIRDVQEEGFRDGSQSLEPVAFPKEIGAAFEQMREAWTGSPRRACRLRCSSASVNASWLAEPLPVLDGSNERLNHFGLDEVSVELVELL